MLPGFPISVVSQPIFWKFSQDGLLIEYRQRQRFSATIVIDTLQMLATLNPLKQARRIDREEYSRSWALPVYSGQKNTSDPQPMPRKCPYLCMSSTDSFSRRICMTTTRNQLYDSTGASPAYSHHGLRNLSPSPRSHHSPCAALSSCRDVLLVTCCAPHSSASC